MIASELCGQPVAISIESAIDSNLSNITQLQPRPVPTGARSPQADLFGALIRRPRLQTAGSTDPTS